MRTLIIAAYLGLTYAALAQTVTFSDIEGPVHESFCHMLELLEPSAWV